LFSYITMGISFRRIFQFLLFRLKLDICIGNQMDVACGYIKRPHSFLHSEIVRYSQSINAWERCSL
jgi:hypothetical protein